MENAVHGVCCHYYTFKQSYCEHYDNYEYITMTCTKQQNENSKKSN